MSTVHPLRTSPQAKRRVLVVDDDLDTVHTMAMLIRSMGHEVQFAINGFAALDVARSFRPDVILLDLRLPDFNGSDIARQLKWEPGLANTRIIAVSGRDDDDVRKRAIDAGCAEFFPKPLDSQTLETLLRQPAL